MSTPPTHINLPAELYRNIAENLSHPYDRGTLCALALVNSLLRTESQRVLFRGISERSHCMRYGASDEYQQVLARQISFLETILDYPTRLGSLVRVYGHMKLSDGGSRQQVLWSLTLRALPHLINLRHLHIISHDLHDPGDDVTLDACCFPHLLSFSWGASTIGRTATPHVLAFLERASTLRHLRVLFDIDSLSPGACPALESFEIDRFVEREVRPSVRSLEPRSIKALAMFYTSASEADQVKPSLPELLLDLKYLKATTLREEDAGYYALRVLQLKRWDKDSLALIGNFPHLHTLALLVPSGRQPVRHLRGLILYGQTDIERHPELLDTIWQYRPGLSRVVGIPQYTKRDWVVWELEEEVLKTRHVKRIEVDRFDQVWWRVFEEMEEMRDGSR